MLYQVLDARSEKDQVLRALNGESTFGTTRLDLSKYTHIERTNGFYAKVKGPPFCAAPDSDYAEADRVLIQTLREYVDEWLQTGRTKEGTEEPATRSLEAAKRACWAFIDYSMNHPPTPICGPVPGFILPFETQRRVCGLDRPIEDAKDEAARLFTLLVTSNWSRSIRKCQRCGTYSVISKNCRSVYKRGTRCRSCSSHESAQRQTDERRKERHLTRLDFAAEGLNKWNQTNRRFSKTNRRSSKEIWLANYVNGRMDQPETITRKWVTRNMLQIEKIARCQE